MAPSSSSILIRLPFDAQQARLLRRIDAARAARGRRSSPSGSSERFITARNRPIDRMRPVITAAHQSEHDGHAGHEDDQRDVDDESRCRIGRAGSRSMVTARPAVDEPHRDHQHHRRQRGDSGSAAAAAQPYSSRSRMTWVVAMLDTSLPARLMRRDQRLMRRIRDRHAAEKRRTRDCRTPARSAADWDGARCRAVPRLRPPRRAGCRASQPRRWRAP